MVGEVICRVGPLYSAGPRIRVGLAKPCHFFSGCMDHGGRLSLLNNSPPAYGTLKDHRLVLLLSLVRLLRVRQRARQQEPQNSEKACWNVFPDHRPPSPFGSVLDRKSTRLNSSHMSISYA